MLEFHALLGNVGQLINIYLMSTHRSNINYELGSKPQRQEVDERTVHNDLYTRQEIPASTSLSASHSTPPLHVYDYASLGVTRTTDPQLLSSPQVPQHTLLHSMASNSDNGSHAYSKPTTPLSNYDRTVNSFDALACSSLPARQANDYSKLNGVQVDPILDQSQSYSEVGGGNYSHIDEAHKYSKLSDMNSKGYSQLDKCGSQATSCEQQRLPEEPAQPYEIPFSPTSNSADPEEELRNHAYSTVAAETDSTGYSKLHVFEGSQGDKKISIQPKVAAADLGATRAGEDAELVDNNAYESSLS